MKKKYEAPAYDVISYSLHDSIAGGCTAQIYDNHSDESSCGLTDLGIRLKNMGVTFTADNNCDVETDAYCYFTSTNMLFNS